jgi:hypothetical protein
MKEKAPTQEETEKMTEKKTLQNIVETLERRVNDIREDFTELKAERRRDLPRASQAAAP